MAELKPASHRGRSLLGDEDWLARYHEPIIDPELPILDPHHHLWDRGSRYLNSGDVLCHSQDSALSPASARAMSLVEEAARGLAARRLARRPPGLAYAPAGKIVAGMTAIRRAGHAPPRSSLGHVGKQQEREP
jgi:hypothetical protein